MRIVSLLPACTDWVLAFGGREMLVGRSHECAEAPSADDADIPTSDVPALADVPAVTRAVVSDGHSVDADAATRSLIGRGLSAYDVDFELLAKLEPDLILTQAQRTVSMEEIEDGLARTFKHVPDIFSFDARSFKGVLQQALSLGRRIRKTREAMVFVAERERELKLLRNTMELTRQTPTRDLVSVLAIEWLDPVMTSGRWVPDLVEMAGGRAVCTEAGLPSQVVAWKAVVDADPEVIVVAPRGYSIVSTHSERSALTERDDWKRLRAVKEHRVFLIDGRYYLNRPGPALYRSVELLALALHGEKVDMPAEKGGVTTLPQDE